MKQLTILETAQFLLQNDHYVILTHRRPDGDTVGCAAALCRGLRQLGKEAAILENPQFMEKFRPWLQGLTTEALGANACVVSVDIAAETLLPWGLPECAVELLIDHHDRNTGFALAGYVEPEAAACGEIILRLLQCMKVQLDKDIADALYVAISTDTGCFRYSNTTAATLRLAAICMDAGADSFAINRALFMTRRMARMKLEARLTESTELMAGGTVAISTIPDSLMEELGLIEDDVDDISGFGRGIEGVEIAVLLRQAIEGGKISLRCSPKYNASAICQRMGGGGHAAAAGATVPGGIEEARAAILRALEECGVAL